MENPSSESSGCKLKSDVYAFNISNQSISVIKPHPNEQTILNPNHQNVGFAWTIPYVSLRWQWPGVSLERQLDRRREVGERQSFHEDGVRETEVKTKNKSERFGPITEGPQSDT